MQCDRVSRDSPTKAVLQEVCAKLKTDPAVQQEASKLYLELQKNDEHWDNYKSRSMIRCAILAASKAKGCPEFTISELLTGPNSLKLSTFIYHLKEFIHIVHLEPPVLFQLKKVIKSFATSLLLFKKFEEIWEGLNLQGREKSIALAKDFVWHLFISAKAKVMNRTEEIFECGCLLIGVLSVFLTHPPKEVSVSLPTPPLQHLCGVLKTLPQQALPVAEEVKTFISTLTNQGNLVPTEGPLGSIFQAENLPTNLEKIQNFYRGTIGNNQIDERELTKPDDRITTPVKRKSLNIGRSQINGRVLNWEDHKVTMHSKLNEIQVPASPQVVPPTPMSMAMELNHWLQVLLEENPDLSVCGSYRHEILVRLTALLQDLEGLFKIHGIGSVTGNDTEFLSQVFAVPATPGSSRKTNKKIEEVSKLYKLSLVALYRKEKSADTSILANEAFHRALFACCVETLLLVQNITIVAFEEVLKVCQTSPFEFWKLISNYAQFDPSMPMHLKRHFREIEIKILTHLAWNRSSQVHSFIKKLLQNYEQNMHPSYNIFFKRVLALAATRTSDICNSLNLSSSVQENIWAAIKFNLSEKTEMLMDRHLDHLILCCIYAVCKCTSEVTFKNLVDKHRNLFGDENEVHKDILLENGTTGDIIQFYNNVFLVAMKGYIMGSLPESKPRIEALNPKSPLHKSVIPGMQSVSALSPAIRTRSPFLTPRTKRLWAFGESPAQDFKSINNFFKSSMQRRINFDNETPQPYKKAKHVMQLLEDDQSSHPEPQLKK